MRAVHVPSWACRTGPSTAPAAAIVACVLLGLLASGHFATAATPQSPLQAGKAQAGQASQAQDPPKPYESLDEYLTDLKKVETEYGGNWKDLVTKLRKNYYNKEATPGSMSSKEKIMNFFGLKPWDLLIAERKNIAPMKPSGAVDQKLLNRLSAAKAPEARVATFNKQPVDLGHLWAGFDSGNFPATSTTAKALFNFKTGVPYATWAGDVGSALSRWIELGRPQGGQQKEYDDFNSQGDQLGNFDGISLAQRAKSKQNVVLSELLLEHYALPVRRASLMLEYFGYSTDKDGLTAASKSAMKEHIKTFATSYYKKSHIGSFFTGVSISDAELNSFCDIFFKQINEMLANESGSGPTADIGGSAIAVGAVGAASVLWAPP